MPQTAEEAQILPDPPLLRGAAAALALTNAALGMAGPGAGGAPPTGPCVGQAWDEEERAR